MRTISALVLVFATACLPTVIVAQQIESPEIHDDGRVTFRMKSAYAATVQVRVARIENGKADLVEDPAGTWQATIGPLEPGIYEYTFYVDGTPQVDRRNRWIKKWYTLENLFEIPGDPPLITELQDVPHGVMHHHVYRSKVTDTMRKVIVYTPPSYSARQDTTYPVLFLLHGFGDDQTAWSEVGRVETIADNLIDADKAKEMIIVLPHGHPEPLPYGKVDDNYRINNDAAMVREIDDVLIPWLEENYRVKRNPEHRAIAGLSMGGGHSIRTALGTNDFAYVGAFSAAAPKNEWPVEIAKNLTQFKKQVKVFWIACGKDDFLLERNQVFVKRMEDQSVPHRYLESAGSHNWGVWRDNYLPKFLPMLFQ